MPIPPAHDSYLLKTKAKQAYFYKHKEKVQLGNGKFVTTKSTRFNLEDVRRINWSAKDEPSINGSMKPIELVNNWNLFYQYVGSTLTLKYINERGRIHENKFSVHDPKYGKGGKLISFLVEGGFDYPWKGSFNKIQNIDLIDPIINFSSSRWLPKGWMDPDFPENYAGGAVKDYRGIDFEDADLSWADFTNADLRGANLKNTNLWNASFLGANLKRTKLKGAYWFRTTCKDGTMNTITKGVELDDFEVINSFSPCTKIQMSENPPWIDDPNYFETHLTSASAADK